MYISTVFKNYSSGVFLFHRKESLHRCSGCLFVWYCDRFCQRQAWVDHKGECKNLTRVKPKFPPDAVRLIARIVLKLQRGGDNEEGHVSSTRSRKFKDLMSHYKEIQNDKKRMEHFATIAMVLSEYLENVVLPNPIELIGIYGRVCVNSFNIVNGELQCIGTGIYLGPTILDHSCSPNAVATFDGKQINIQLIEDLPFLDWDRIRISYIDQMNSTADRLKELKERYYFTCDCPRCTSGDVNRHQYAFKCQNCSRPIPVMVSITHKYFMVHTYFFLLFNYIYRRNMNFPSVLVGSILIRNFQRNIGKQVNLVSISYRSFSNKKQIVS